MRTGNHSFEIPLLALRRGTKKKKKIRKRELVPHCSLYFKDFPRPLNQKYCGARYFSRKKKSTFPLPRKCTWYIGPFFTFFSKKKKKRRGKGGGIRTQFPGL